MRTLPTRVLLVDDEELVRRGLAELLGQEDDLLVCGEAATAADAVSACASLDPDVVVLDVRLPDGDGASVCRQLQSASPGTACLMLSSNEDDEAMVAFGLHQFNGHGYERVEVLRVTQDGKPTDSESGICAVVFAARNLDPEPGARAQVQVDGNQIHLTTKEFDLLAHMAASPGRIFTRDQLLARIWGYD